MGGGNAGTPQRVHKLRFLPRILREASAHAQLAVTPSMQSVGFAIPVVLCPSAEAPGQTLAVFQLYDALNSIFDSATADAAEINGTAMPLLHRPKTRRFGSHLAVISMKCSSPRGESLASSHQVFGPANFMQTGAILGS